MEKSDARACERRLRLGDLGGGVAEALGVIWEGSEK
jgi:hypothetical protein